MCLAPTAELVRQAKVLWRQNYTCAFYFDSFVAFLRVNPNPQLDGGGNVTFDITAARSRGLSPVCTLEHVLAQKY